MQTIELRSDSAECSIRFIPTVWNVVQPEQVFCRIEICVPALFVARDDVLVRRRDLDRFLPDLSQLEHTRRGQAVLCENPAGEFLLSLEVVDQPGHIVATTIQSWPVHLRYGGLQTQSFRISFDADPGGLMALLRSFQSLANVLRPAQYQE